MAGPASESHSRSATARDVIARLNRIPVWAFPPSFLAIIGMGYFFTFFDITNIGFAMPAIAVQFGLTGSESLFVALAIGLIGYIFGSYIIGTLSDRYGRFNMMLVTMVLIAIGSFGDAVATSVITLSLWRFVTGMGVGADLNLVSTYIGELAPSNKRGRISMLTFLIGIVGQSITPFVALALVPEFAIGWRLLFAIGGIVAVIAIAMRFKLSESPRWLALHGRMREANAVVTKMEAFARKKVKTLPKPKPGDVDLSKGRFPTYYLFRRQYATRLLMFASMWFFWYIGNYGFLGDAATLLAAQGLTIENSILFIAVGAVGYPVGAFVMAKVADRFERKWLILCAAAVWLVGMALIGTLSSYSIMLGSFLAALSLGLYLQIAYTFTAESYPTRARASGFALSDGIGHIGGAVGALALPIMVSAFGFGVAFAAIGVTGLAAGIIALAGPVASRLSLEEVSA